MADESIDRGELLKLTTEIVAAHVGNNAIAGSDLAALIQSVFDTLGRLAADEPAAAELTPAVPIRRSVTDDHIVCLEDGKKLKTLKRHLMSDHGLTPEAYRARWGLKPDYPMVAPNYSAQRQAMAKQIGLGRKPAPPPEPEKPKRRRKRRPPESADSVRTEPAELHRDPGQQRDQRRGGDDVHRGLHRRPPHELDALEQRLHVVDGQHRVLAAEPDVGGRPTRALPAARASIASN